LDTLCTFGMKYPCSVLPVSQCRRCILQTSSEDRPARMPVIRNSFSEGRFTLKYSPALITSTTDSGPCAASVPGCTWRLMPLTFAFSSAGHTSGSAPCPASWLRSSRTLVSTRSHRPPTAAQREGVTRAPLARRKETARATLVPLVQSASLALASLAGSMLESLALVPLAGSSSLELRTSPVALLLRMRMLRCIFKTEYKKKKKHHLN
jgi:hypothetical protein